VNIDRITRECMVCKTAIEKKFVYDKHTCSSLDCPVRNDIVSDLEKGRYYYFDGPLMIELIPEENSNEHKS